MAGILNTNGAVISGTAVFFENFDVIRYSAAQALAAVSLRVTSGGVLDLSAELNFAPARIVAFSGGGVLTTGSGTDSLTGGVGNDTLNGGAGADTLLGGGGNDRLDGGAAVDTCRGGAGNDVYVVTNGDLFYENANEGTDTVYCPVDFTLPVNFENAVLTGAAFNMAGNASNNVLTGNAQGNILSGMSGNDTLLGGLGGDLLLGALGNDVIRGGAGADTLDGGDGVDTLNEADRTVGVGIDLSSVRLSVDTGGDFYSLEDSIAGFEHATGGSGKDILVGDGLANRLTGNGGDDLLSDSFGNDTLDGGAGNDTLFGGADVNVLLGGTGNDVIQVARSSTDTFNGGSGTDVLEVIEKSFNRLTLDAAAGFEILRGFGGFSTGISGTGGNDQFNLGAITQVTDITGFQLGGGNDSYAGSADDELVFGGVGNDTLNGGADDDDLYGNENTDTLNGQAGNDFLIGGAGADRFLFNSALNVTTNIDRVTDFHVPDDTIWLDDAVFRALAPGVLKAADFVIGGAASNGAQNIIYDQVNGTLSYDPDGIGTAAQVEFAILPAGVLPTVIDFLIV